MFCGTALFENTEDELDIWLLHLQQVPTEETDDVIMHLEKSLAALFTKPYLYTDTITDVLSEVYSRDGSQTSDLSSASTSDSLIDSKKLLEYDIFHVN